MVRPSIGLNENSISDADRDVISSPHPGGEIENPEGRDVGSARKFPSLQDFTDSFEQATLANREAWLDHINKMDDVDLLSPRVVGVLPGFHILRRKFPGEKIVVMLQFLIFLDLLALWFARYGEDNYFRYAITVKSASERSHIEKAFKKDTTGSLLLMATGAGKCSLLNLLGGTSTTHLYHC